MDMGAAGECFWHSHGCKLSHTTKPKLTYDGLDALVPWECATKKDIFLAGASGIFCSEVPYHRTDGTRNEEAAH